MASAHRDDHASPPPSPDASAPAERAASSITAISATENPARAPSAPNQVPSRHRELLVQNAARIPVVRHALTTPGPLPSRAAEAVTERMSGNIPRVLASLYQGRRITNLTVLTPSHPEKEVSKQWARVLSTLMLEDGRFDVAQDEPLGTAAQTAGILPSEDGTCASDHGSRSTTGSRAPSGSADIVITFSTSLAVGNLAPRSIPMPLVVCEVKPENTVSATTQGLVQLFWYMYLAARSYKSTCGIFFAGPHYWIFSIDRSGALWHHGITHDKASTTVLEYAREIADRSHEMPRLPDVQDAGARHHLETLVETLAHQIEYSGRLERVRPQEYGEVFRAHAPILSYVDATQVTEKIMDIKMAQELKAVHDAKSSTAIDAMTGHGGDDSDVGDDEHGGGADDPKDGDFRSGGGSTGRERAGGGYPARDDDPGMSRRTRSHQGRQDNGDRRHDGRSRRILPGGAEKSSRTVSMTHKLRRFGQSKLSIEQWAIQQRLPPSKDMSPGQLYQDFDDALDVLGRMPTC